MRILYSHRIQSRDGQAVHVEELVAALRAAGHEVLMVGPSFYDSADHEGSRRLAAVRRLLPGALGEVAELGYNAIAIRRLARAYDTFRPDIVYERYSLFHLAGSWLARRRGATLLLEVNAPLAQERARHDGLRLARLARAVERATWRSAAAVLPVTAVLGQAVEAAGVPPERIVVVPNGIVPERFPAPSRDPSPSRLVLGFVGFVREWHGLGAVLDAMAADPAPGGLPLELVVVGDGPALPGLRAQAAALGIAERLRLRGVVPNHQVPAEVAGFDIALQPRVTAYASPLKVFDYMAAGCAIVAPDQPNIREVLEHEATALLFDPRNEAQAPMWDAVRRLAVDTALRHRLGAAARTRALERHTWAANAERVATLGRELARRRVRTP